jgi:hypothetical protein
VSGTTKRSIILGGSLVAFSPILFFVLCFGYGFSSVYEMQHAPSSTDKAAYEAFIHHAATNEMAFIMPVSAGFIIMEGVGFILLTVGLLRYFFSSKEKLSPANPS